MYATATPQVNAGLLTSVDNPGNAADGNPSTFSVMNRLVGVGNLITVTQYLSFPSQITSGTPVTVKVNLPAGLISLLGGVQIQPFTGLNYSVLTGWQANAAGSGTTVSSLVGVAAGAGDMELTVTPTANYDGVWVTMSGVAVGQSMKLYDAYVMKTTPTQSDCGTAVDVLAGTRAALGISLLNASGTVDNPTNAIDNDATTYAQLNVGAQVLSEAYLTTIFNTPSQPGDVVRMLLRNVSGGLLNLGLISNFTIQLYNGSTPVGSPILSASSALKLTALSGTSVSDLYQLDISSLSTDLPFDRVDIQIGGVAAVGTSLRVYDVRRLPATPVTSMDGVTSSSKSVCQGSSSTLAVSNPQSSCTTYSWYSSASGGTALATGTSYTPPASGLGATNTYYVQANRTGCTEVSDRIPVTINVNPSPTISYSVTPRTCKGTTTASMSYSSSNTPTTYSIVWNAPALAVGFTNVTNAVLPVGTLTVAVPAGAAANTYTGTITVQNGNGCLSTGAPFSVIVDDKPTSPVLTVAN
ncbi:immunoglobulin domain-containing protein [Mucilaginibacter agri]|uniref:Ig-like domain-containing protein n=1 Tax=Mucilaginibacter agri TaxID=2695265 RepID=A0A965ZFE0_9SPHI|nr:hypothetical protein [Mucilaginibacter agri]NCD68746.1 hypothetical protein [Mucilaginibacter agri]